MWDGESDPACCPLPITAAQAFLDAQDGALGEESVMSRVPCGQPFEFSTPGSLPVLLPIPDLTLSLSPLIALLRRGPFDVIRVTVE